MVRIEECPYPKGACRRPHAGQPEYALSVWTGLLLVCGLAFSLQAQQDPTDLLLKVRGRVKDSVNRLPKYMCTQTIDRQQYEPARGKQAARCDDSPAQKDLHVTTSDRLRFDRKSTRLNSSHRCISYA